MAHSHSAFCAVAAALDTVYDPTNRAKRGHSVKKRIVVAAAISATAFALALSILAYLLVHRDEGSYFDSNGLRIHYTVEGKGEPVILIHGVAANADLNWRRPGVIKALSRNFEVIAFDLRGHGLSGKSSDPAAYGSEMVEDISRLMDHLHIRKAHIAGYSLGGFIALKFITTHPERVQSAAICAAGWKNADDPSPVPNPYKPPKKPGAAKSVQAGVAAESGTPKTIFHRVRSWIGDRLMDKNVKKALKENYIQLAVPLPDLEKNAIPSICFVGTRDGFLYLAEDLKARMPNTELVELAGASHFTMPFYGAFKRGLETFFKKHPISAAETR